MINAIFASEFDLQKGCLIKAHYPQNILYNENLLASYMIPDGVHKIDQDYYFFKMKTIIPDEHWMVFNDRQVCTYKYNLDYGQWDNYFESQQQTLHYEDGKFVIRNEEQSMTLNCAEMRVYSQDFVSFNQDVGVLFREKDLPLESLTCNSMMYYFCMITNKKDQSIKRGSLIRSIAVTSYDLHFFMAY